MYLQQLFSLMDAKDQISAVISILNIATTIILTGFNSFFLWKTKSVENRNRSFAEYYSHILYLAEKIVYLQKAAILYDSNFKVWAPQTARDKEYSEQIIKLYNEFSNFVQSKTPSYRDKELCSTINRLRIYVDKVIRSVDSTTGNNPISVEDDQNEFQYLVDSINDIWVA